MGRFAEAARPTPVGRGKGRTVKGRRRAGLAGGNLAAKAIVWSACARSTTVSAVIVEEAEQVREQQNAYRDVLVRADGFRYTIHLNEEEDGERFHKLGDRIRFCSKRMGSLIASHYAIADWLDEADRLTEATKGVESNWSRKAVRLRESAAEEKPRLAEKTREWEDLRERCETAVSELAVWLDRLEEERDAAVQDRKRKAEEELWSD